MKFLKTPAPGLRRRIGLGALMLTLVTGAPVWAAPDEAEATGRAAANIAEVVNEDTNAASSAAASSAAPANEAQPTDASLAPAGAMVGAAGDVPPDLAKAFEARFPGAEVLTVRPTGYPQLFEIQVGTDLLYTNADVDFVMHGTLIDAATRRDLTELRQETLAKQAFDALPLDRAIKQVRGDGSRRMAIFEDPNCGFCKQLHRTLEGVDNVTLYTFLYPILSPDSTVKSRNIWCAKDRVAAWRDWMLNGKQPPTATCETPIEENLALGKQLLVRGTPAIFFADGSRLNGAAPAETLKEVLDRQAVEG